MKNYRFTVVFTNHDFEVVYAGCRAAAVILAQAKQIEKGHSYNVEFVKDENERVIW